MATVGCAGILVADTFCGPMPRLPGAGELLAIDQMSSKAGGCGQCGHRSGQAGDLSRRLRLRRERLVGRGVGAESASCRGRLRANSAARQTSHKQDRRSLGRGGRPAHIHVFGANAGFEVAHVRPSWIDGLKVFYFGGLFATPAIRTDELAELFVQCRAPALQRWSMSLCRRSIGGWRP